MKHPVEYQSLFDQSIFIGGARCVVNAVTNENIDVIIDLRAEAIESEWKEDNRVKWVHIPLVDNEAGQQTLLKQAIDVAVDAFHHNQKVLIHWAAGRSRAGSVAIGILLALGESVTIEEATEKVRMIRPEVSVSPTLIYDLKKINFFKWIVDFYSSKYKW